MAIPRQSTAAAAFDVSFDEPDTAQTVTYTTDAGTNKFMIVSVTWNDSAGHTLTGITYNGDALTPFDATPSDSTNCKKQTFYRKEPDVGSSLDLVISTASGTAAAAASVDVMVYTGVDQTDSFDWMTPTTGQDTTPGTAGGTGEAEITVSSATGCKIVALFGAEFAATATAATLTGVTEFLENHNSTVSSAVGDADGEASLTADAVWTVGFGNADWCAHGISLNPAVTASAAITGTAGDGTTEALVVAGGQTVIITLTDDTWVASGVTFDAQRQAIIDGLDSAQSEAAGWNAEVRDNESVTAVVRTSDTVCTITLSASASYAITATETITVTVPAAALTGAAPLTATPTFTVTPTTTIPVRMHHYKTLAGA